MQKVVHYMKQDKWHTYELTSNEDFMRGYLGDNVIIFNCLNKKKQLLNLKMNKRRDIKDQKDFWFANNFYGGTAMI